MVCSDMDFAFSRKMKVTARPFTLTAPSPAQVKGRRTNPKGRWRGVGYALDGGLSRDK